MLIRLLALTIFLVLPLFFITARTVEDLDDSSRTHAADLNGDNNEDDHDGETAGHEDEDDHLDELAIVLSPAVIELAGIKTATATLRRIEKSIELPGEIGFNEDRLAHIAPRFAGIAQEARVRVGDYVEKGSVVAVIESNESMNSYSIPAPISGWVIARHITPGEFVSGENSIYVIADLSSVWVNLALYPRDVDRVQKGQLVQIKAVGSTNSTTGVIDYITPIIDLRTRSATARITLSNLNNTWRPGTFVQGTIVTRGEKESLVVEKDAVQFLANESVLLVVDGPNRFKPIEVVTGESDATFTEIVSGLKKGTEYVSHGAFELKAKIVTSNLDAHAGHGH